MDPSYTNPLGGQYQPTDYPPQGDIILTPDRPRARLDKKRILILAGVGFVVLMLFVLVIMNIVKGGEASTADVKALFSDNYECIRELEDNTYSSQKVATFLSSTTYETVSECVSQLTAIKGTIESMGSWSNSQVSRGAFDTLKTDIVDLINSVEQKLPTYKRFVDVYALNDTTQIAEFLSDEESEDDSNAGIRTAAVILDNYMTQKNYFISVAGSEGCDLGGTFLDSNCELLKNAYNKALSEFINATAVADYFNSAFTTEMDKTINQRILSIIGEPEQ